MRKAQRHIHAVPEGQGLDRDQALVVIHGEDRVIMSCALRHGTACRRKAGRSPCDRVPSGAATRRARSHSFPPLPSMPSSPAWGLSPATARRGAAMPKSRASAFRMISAVSRIASLVMACGTSRQRRMDGQRHHPQLFAGQHHHRARRLGEGAQEFGMAGIGKARLFQHRLVDRGGDHGARPRPQGRPWPRSRWLRSRRRHFWDRACRAWRWPLPWWGSAMLRARRKPPHRPPASGDGCRSCRPA